MATHDKRLRQLVSLLLDSHAAKGDMVTLSEIVTEARVKFPYRDVHPRDQLAAEIHCYSMAVKNGLKEPLSREYIEKELPPVPKEFRKLIGELTAWFYVITQGRWVHSLNATPEHWEAGAEMRIEMARRTAAMAEPYQEKAEILREAKAKNIRQLLNGKK
jgi:hypothetical protein